MREDWNMKGDLKENVNRKVSVKAKAKKKF